jgi:NAD(P)-dependent dehydrogenase (short-subunit alcohol dehydrogenase family)
MVPAAHPIRRPTRILDGHVDIEARNMNMELKKKTVLITGCSSGIGHSTAKLFASNGWQVVATMRDPSKANSLSALPNVSIVRLDVTDTASIESAVTQALSEHAQINVVVNNAGFGAFGPFETATPALVDRLLATNLIGVFNVIREVLPVMRMQRQGTIINVASIGGLTTMPLNSIYHATKYAIVGFTESLIYELAPFGIRAKIIVPGGVDTDFSGRSLNFTFHGDGHAYADEVARVTAAFRARASAYSQPEDIANEIFKAATDDLPKVKYVVGADAEALLAARAKSSDEEYVAMMTERFGLTANQPKH